MKKLVKVLAVIASISGVCFIFKDTIKDAVTAVKEKFSDPDFDDFDDDDDFDEKEIFGKTSDREYVDITITDDDDDEELEDEDETEEDETEEEDEDEANKE